MSFAICGVRHFVVAVLFCFVAEKTVNGVDSLDSSLGATGSLDDRLLHHNPLPRTSGEKASNNVTRREPQRVTAVGPHVYVCTTFFVFCSVLVGAHHCILCMTSVPFITAVVNSMMARRS